MSLDKSNVVSPINHMYRHMFSIQFTIAKLVFMISTFLLQWDCKSFNNLKAYCRKDRTVTRKVITSSKAWKVPILLDPSGDVSFKMVKYNDFEYEIQWLICMASLVLWPSQIKVVLIFRSSWTISILDSWNYSIESMALVVLNKASLSS